MLKSMAMLALGLGAAVFSGSAAGQSLGGVETESRFLEAMVGTWDVSQRMWTGLGAEPTELPPAVAKRELAAGGGFVTEVMTLARPGSTQPFTRTANINYNLVDGVFEYASLDTRAPQQMHYQSQAVSPDFTGQVDFRGGTFIAVQWGDRKDAAFAYRVELSPVRDGAQTLSLFLRPLATGPQAEFKAFQYDYKRRD